MLIENLPNVQALAPADKWRLIEELWRDLAQEVEGSAPSRSTIDLLEQRFASYLADHASACPESEVFDRIAVSKRVKRF